jgi:hypothetical protein
MRRIVFKKNVLLELSGLPNPHQLALRSRVSSPTIAKYVNAPETSEVIDAAVLASILIDGLGKSEKEVLNLRLGDLFEFVDSPKE